MSILTRISTSAALAVSLSLTPVQAQAADTIKVGWTNLTEQAMLGYMAALIIEKQLGLATEQVANLGGTGIAQQALISGSIDVSIE